MESLFELLKVIDDKSTLLFYLVKDVQKILLLYIMYNYKFKFTINMHFPFFETILNNYYQNSYNNSNDNYNNGNDNKDKINYGKLIYGNFEIINVLWLKYVATELPKNYRNISTLEFMKLYSKAVKYYKTIIRKKMDPDIYNQCLYYDIIFKNNGIIKSLFKKISANKDADLSCYNEIDNIIYFETTKFNTLLSKAANCNNLPLVKLLYNKGANIEHPEPEYPSALCYAIENNNYELAKYLVNNKADVNLNFDKETLLILSTDHCNPDIVKLIIKKMNKNIINKKSYEGLSALDYLLDSEEVTQNYVDVIQILIEHGAEIDYSYDRRCYDKCEANTKIFKIILENSNAEECNKKNDPVAAIICEYGDEFLIKSMINKKFNLNQPEITCYISPLMLLCKNYDLSENPNLDLIKLLIDNGADINYRSYFGVNNCAYKYSKNTIIKSFLLQNGYKKLPKNKI